MLLMTFGHGTDIALFVSVRLRVMHPRSRHNCAHSQQFDARIAV